MTLEQLLAGVVIAIDKPRQWTSFQAVNKVKAAIRNTYGIKKFKIGHAGTLDPLATGLLLVCVGKATKLIPSLQDGTKVYTGTMVLGATTPCYDLEQAIDHFYPYFHITPQLLETQRATLEGTIMQVPPMFSAVKIEGQRAYEYARADDPTATIAPKPVCIHSFEITQFRPRAEVAEGFSQQDTEAADGFSQQDTESTCNTPHEKAPTAPAARAPHLYDNPQGSVPPHLPQVDFRICCGKGTYIRSLARDFGLSLGSGAFLSALRREQVGEYTIAQAIKLDDINSYLMS